MATSITYNSLSLTSNGIFVTDTDVYSMPKANLQSETLAEADGAVLVKRQFEPKVFSCEGFLSATTNALLDALIDTLKTALNDVEKNFDIDWGSGTRRYVATAQNLILSRPKGLNSATFSLEFFCASPVGSDTSSSTLLSTSNTQPTANPSVSPAGSYQAEPYITLTLNSGTGLTSSKSITIANGTTLRGVTITRDWTAGDVLEIDCLNKQLFVNDAVVAFSGQFPKWDTGSGSLSYADDFATRNVSIFATYTKRYL